MGFGWCSGGRDILCVVNILSHVDRRTQTYLMECVCLETLSEVYDGRLPGEKGVLGAWLLNGT